MKIKIILGLAFILVCTYLYLFTGTVHFSNVQRPEMEHSPSSTIILPLDQLRKGFLSHTVYTRSSWEGHAAQLMLKINYYDQTVTFEDSVLWNKEINNKRKEKLVIKPLYKYFSIDDPGFWRDLEKQAISYRLFENGEAKKQIIVNTRLKTVKLRL